MLLCIILAEVLAIFIDANTRIEAIQIGDHEIKIVNFADNTTIFFRDFICLTKIELILKLPPKVSSSKIKFFKKPVLMRCGIIRIDKPRQMAWSQFSIKMVGVHFHNSAHSAL